jgi:hypothetical protein
LRAELAVGRTPAVVVYADTSKPAEGQFVDTGDTEYVVGVEDYDGQQLSSFKPFTIRDYVEGPATKPAK